MPSAVRISIIMVLLLATAALGLLALNVNAPKGPGAAATTVSYFVAARPLTKRAVACCTAAGMLVGTCSLYSSKLM